MPSTNKDKVVVSLGDALLRQSDVDLLRGPHWLNDQVIGFYLTYLYERKFENASRICFISPEVSQFLKMAGAEELAIFLDPLSLSEKDVILLPVNNHVDPSQPGGSHWSLLVFSRQAREFFHLDSSSDLNQDDAKRIAKKVHQFLIKQPGQPRFDLCFNEVPVLKQNNSYDCGIHLLCYAEHSTRHFLVYGSAQGLDALTPAVVQKKRAEILDVVTSMSR